MGSQSDRVSDIAQKVSSAADMAQNVRSDIEALLASADAGGERAHKVADEAKVLSEKAEALSQALQNFTKAALE
jgi:methyl-accepting chemotaxis protein